MSEYDFEGGMTFEQLKARDAQRLSALLREKGYVTMTADFAARLWAEHSYGVFASWLSMPRDDGRLLACVDEFHRDCPHCGEEWLELRNSAGEVVDKVRRVTA